MLSYEEFSDGGIISASDCEPDPCNPDYGGICEPDCDPTENDFDCWPYT